MWVKVRGRERKVRWGFRERAECAGKTSARGDRLFLVITTIFLQGKRGAGEGPKASESLIQRTRLGALRESVLIKTKKET